MTPYEPTETTPPDTPLPAAAEAPPTVPESAESVREALAAKTQELDRLQDRLVRLQAEFENSKKRMAREKADFLKFAHENLILDFLPVLDNLERALRAARAEMGSSPLIEGLEMIARLFRNVLDKAGVKAIEALGQPFDPAIHQAVAQVDADGDGDPVVVDEVQKGYSIEGRILRPAMVKVSRAASPGTGEPPSPEECRA
jgi:molecular chaperone GrpE